MPERTVYLAHGLAASVSIDEASWLGLLPVMPSDSAAPRARLHVQPAPPGAVWPSSERAESLFWGQLSWDSGSSASFVVPGGLGTVQLEPASASPLAIQLQLDIARPDRGLESALRLTLALLLALEGGYLLHCSAVVIAETAVLCLGQSGAGKTTTARRLGREGALRIADDLLVVRRIAGELWAECCRFDRASNLPGRTGTWVLACAYHVRKHAPVTACRSGEPGTFAAWAAALFMPPFPPGRAEQCLDDMLDLARRVPVRTLAAAPSGGLLPAIRDDLQQLSLLRARNP